MSEINGFEEQPGSSYEAFHPSSARTLPADLTAKNVAQEICDTLRACKLLESTRSMLREYVTSGISFRICLVSLAMDKCILSSNLLKADYEESSKIHSSKAHSKNRKNSDQILDFMALPCSQCWAFKSIREKKVLELEDPTDFEQFYDTACMAMQDLKSFRKPNIVSVPLLTKEDPEKSSLGVLLVMLKTSTDKFVLASDSDNESEALEMREKCRDLVEENLDSKASLEMHASDYDHLVCLAQDIADIGHNYLQNIIYNAMAPLMPSSKHGWGNAGGLIVDPRFRNSGLKAFSINPSGRKDYVTSSNSDGFLDSSLSSGKTRSGALQSSDFDLPALENACTEQPESEDYGVDTMDYISDTDSEVDLGEMPIPTPAHDEAFDKFLKWRLFFQDPEMEEFYNLWRNEHVSQRDCLLFVLLFLGFIVQFFSQINIAWIGNLNLPFDFPDQKHAEEDLSHFSGSKKLLGFDLAANLSISIYRIFAMLWIYGLGFMESLPKLINLRTIVQVVVPSILFLRLSLNSSGRRRKIYRHVRDFNVNFTFVLVVGAHVFFPMKKNIQSSDLNLYNLVLNNFTGKLAVDFDAAVMTAAFLGIVLQLKFYFYLISMIVLLSLHAIIETDFAIIGMGFLSLLPCVCLYLTERWNRRRFLLSPLASDWIW